jgi:hypothetical protein
MNASAPLPSSRPSERPASDAISAAERSRDGICDSKLTELYDAESLAPGSGLRLVASAVAQMITTDDGPTRVNSAKQLEVPYLPLRDLSIGGYPLCPNSNSDFIQFLDHTCIVGSTAVLVGPRHVLTTAHSVRTDHIVAHKFVFNRTTNAKHVVVDKQDKKLIVPAGSFYTARRLVAYIETPFADCAVLELYRDVTDIAPLGIGRWRPTLAADYFGHPLGLPLMYAEIQPQAADPARVPSYLVAVDAGSGGSGSPIIQSGEVVGVIRGLARIDPDDVTEQHCLAPKKCSCPQPFTPASYFAPSLSGIIGW